MDSESRSFIVRPMRRDEVGLIREWATVEGWNPGLHDGPCFFETDPSGFFLGLLADEPIACISCVKYDDSFGFLGQYIVKQPFRKQGYGIQLWQAGMEHLRNQNVGLDGVVAQQENYRKSGFQFHYNHIRYRAIGASGETAPGIIGLSQFPFSELAQYDRLHFPASRIDFLRHWIDLPGVAALGSVHEGNLNGYGVIRPCVEGFKIGPLFADDPATADTLFQSLLTTAPGQAVFIDAPDDTANPNISEFVRRHALTDVFQTARMYTKAAPNLSLHQVYGVTSLELG